MGKQEGLGGPWYLVWDQWCPLMASATVHLSQRVSLLLSSSLRILCPDLHKGLGSLNGRRVVVTC